MNFLKFSRYLLKFLNKKQNKIVLSGGQSLKIFYKFFFNYLDKKKININVFLSDERCLNLPNKNLNENLFSKVKNFIPILQHNKTFSECALLYEKKITKFPNFILLSVGNDGHIASIFKNSKALKSKKEVIFLNKKYNSFKRITLTLKYLKNKKIILFCKNSNRYKIFLDCLENKNHIIYKLYKLNNKIELIFKNKILKKEIYKKIL